MSFVVGIAGGSGSGKSTIVERLLGSVHAPSIAFLPHDAYYLDGERMPEAIRRQRNWDHPEALDNALYVEDIDRLRTGQPVARPVYDFATHSRTTATVRVEPRPIVLLEGILLFAVAAIRERIDLRVFVDTPADLRILRRMKRDIAERGRTFDAVEQQYLETVRPMHERHVEPERLHAHLVVPWLVRNEQAVEAILARIASAVS